MSNNQLEWMADELRAEGLNVVEHDGWETRSSSTVNTYDPVGLLNHHTAGSSILFNYPDPPYWTNSRLEDSCNITIRPDGVVVVLNAGYAYDSGRGDPKVLERLKRDEPPTAPVDFTSADRINGNPHFIDIEVQHKGDGGSIHPPQYRALIATNAVILNHYGWNPWTRLLGHRDWTLRKIDPRWNGFSNPMHTIRTDTSAYLEDIMPTPEAIAQAVWEHNVQSGITAALALDRNYRNISELIVAHRAGTLGADLQADDVQELVDAIVGAGIAESVADELSARLVS